MEKIITLYSMVDESVFLSLLESAGIAAVTDATNFSRAAFGTLLHRSNRRHRFRRRSRRPGSARNRRRFSGKPEKRNRHDIRPVAQAVVIKVPPRPIPAPSGEKRNNPSSR